LLIIAAGRGMVGTRDGRRVVEAGDVVAVMPDEWPRASATRRA